MEFTRADAIQLRSGIAKVKAGAAIGTAFFVAPGRLLTCRHVVEDSSQGPPKILWDKKELSVDKVVVAEVGLGLDAAILEVTLKDHPILKIGPASSLNAPIFTFGYQFAHRGYDGYPALGGLAGYARETASGRDLLHIVDATIAPGLSGAPVYSLVDRAVVGIIKRSRAEGGGYAVPIEQIAELDVTLQSVNAVSASTEGSRRDPLASYIRNLAAEHEFVPLLDVHRTMRLDEIFVSLTLTRGEVSHTKLDLSAGGRVALNTPDAGYVRMARRDRGTPQRAFTDPTISLFDIVAYPKAVVIGEPGSGKTTLLRHLVRRICDGHLVRERLPVFAKLCDVGHGVGCIEDWIRTARSSVAKELMAAVAEGQCFLLLDGLDEVPRAHHGVLAREIERLAALGNQVLLSCRSISFPKGLFGSDFRVFECVGFNSAQQRRFLTKWFAQSERALSLEQQINSHAGLVGFGRNPLLLSLIALVTEKEPDFALPLRRSDLYAKAIRILIEWRVSARRSNLAARKKIDVLTYIASKAFHEGIEVFSEDDLVARIQEWIDQHQERVDADELLGNLTETDGIFALQAPQQYRFLHLTFQEYLTAAQIVRSDQHLATVRAHMDEPRWEEVIRLTCGLLPAPKATEIVRALLAPGGGGRAAKRTILAARACSDSVDLPSELIETVAQALLRLCMDEGRPHVLDAEDALAALCATHEGLMEHLVLRQAVEQELSGQRIIRLLGATADQFSKRVLESQWRSYETTSLESEGNLYMFGATIDAIGQAGASEHAPALIGLLSSPSSYVVSAAARALLLLQPFDLKQELVARLEQGRSRDERCFALHVLLSFQDEGLSATLFNYAFTNGDRFLQKAFAYHFNRLETELDPELFRKVWRKVNDPAGLAHLLSMYRCFLHPSLFEQLRRSCHDPETAPTVRTAAISSLLRLEIASLMPLLQDAAAALKRGEAELLRAVIAGTPTAMAEELGRQLLHILDERERRKEVRLLLRFAFSNRVKSLRNWIEAIADDREIMQQHVWRILLALAALGSSTFLRHADFALAGDARIAIADRVSAYRGLGLLHTNQAKQVLVAAIEREHEPAIATEVIRSIARYHDAEALDILLRVLYPQNWPKSWPPPEPPRRQGDQRASDQRHISVVLGLQDIADPATISHLEDIANGKHQAFDDVREAAAAAALYIRWNSGQMA